MLNALKKLFGIAPTVAEVPAPAPVTAPTLVAEQATQAVVESIKPAAPKKAAPKKPAPAKTAKPKAPRKPKASKPQA
jgi:hypothetical protein